MASKFIKVDPFDLVVFGGTGDLAYRKLYPALYNREKSDQFTDPTRIIGVSRRPMEREAFRASVRDALSKYGDGEPASPEILERFLNRLDYVSADASTDLGPLKERLGPEERIRAFYTATGPDLFGPIARRLGEAGLATPRSRIIVEKPIGARRESARPRSTTRSARCSWKRTFSASTIISARNPFRT